MFRSSKLAFITTMALMALFLGTGTAYAYWTITGSGTGTATVAALEPLAIEPAPVTGLVIGQPQELTGIVTNSNAFDISLVESTFAVTGSVDAAHHGCLFADNFLVQPPAPSAESVLANSTATFGGGSITMVDNASVNQVACQGAVVTLAYVLD